MRKRSFYRVLGGIVSTVLAGTVGTVACGGAATSPVGDDGGTPPAPLPDESTFTCTSPLGEIIANLRPASPVDHVELRGQHFATSTNEPARDGDAGSIDDADGGDTGPPPALLPTETLSSHGTPCATASDRDACMTALADARIDAGGWRNRATGVDMGIPPTYRHDFIVYTRGDEVGIAKNAAELAAFLGPIDTLEEARLLMTTQLHDLECSTEPFKSGWRQNADGSWEVLVTGRSCGTDYQVRMKVTADGVVSQLDRRTLESGAVCGRRPDGLVAEHVGGAEVSIAAWLAEAAHLEAASVVAFRRLERELLALGAPRALVATARRSRADEIRHAREMAILAHRFGAAPAKVEVAPQHERTPFAIALENAVEGCVRETYGALVAAYQARMATDPELRSVLGRIARDEARHASLAHDVARWLEPRLSEGERAEIARARAKAIADLRSAVLRPPATDVARLAGMPRPREARALLEALEHDVLSRAA